MPNQGKRILETRQVKGKCGCGRGGSKQTKHSPSALLCLQQWLMFRITQPSQRTRTTSRTGHAVMEILSGRWCSVRRLHPLSHIPPLVDKPSPEDLSRTCCLDHFSSVKLDAEIHDRYFHYAEPNIRQGSERVWVLRVRALVHMHTLCYSTSTSIYLILLRVESRLSEVFV